MLEFSLEPTDNVGLMCLLEDHLDYSSDLSFILLIYISGDTFVDGCLNSSLNVVFLTIESSLLVFVYLDSTVSVRDYINAIK